MAQHFTIKGFHEKPKKKCTPPMFSLPLYCQPTNRKRPHSQTPHHLPLHTRSVTKTTTFLVAEFANVKHDVFGRGNRPELCQCWPLLPNIPISVGLAQRANYPLTKTLLNPQRVARTRDYILSAEERGEVRQRVEELMMGTVPGA